MATLGQAGKKFTMTDSLIDRLEKWVAEIPAWGIPDLAETEFQLGSTTTVSLVALLREAVDDLADWESSFALYWKAMQRGSKAWRMANPGNELVLPDTGKLVEWLIEQLDQHRSTLIDANTFIVNYSDERYREKTVVVTMKIARVLCKHDYEAEDDKGWRCKLCGHTT